MGWSDITWRRLWCAVVGHEAWWKHPQQTQVWCAHCDHLVARTDRWFDPEE